jgi:hypothetical protein
MIFTTSGKMLSVGWNENHAHYCMFSLHSEVYAVESMEDKRHERKHFRKGLVVVNLAFTPTTENGEARVKNSKPCRHCAFIMKRNKAIRKVYWTTKEGTFECATPEECFETGMETLTTKIAKRKQKEVSKF